MYKWLCNIKAKSYKTNKTILFVRVLSNSIRSYNLRRNLELFRVIRSAVQWRPLPFVKGFHSELGAFSLWGKQGRHFCFPRPHGLRGFSHLPFLIKSDGGVSNPVLRRIRVNYQNVQLAMRSFLRDAMYFLVNCTNAFFRNTSAIIV